jgi:hypothetical protein
VQSTSHISPWIAAFSKNVDNPAAKQLEARTRELAEAREDLAEAGDLVFRYAYEARLIRRALHGFAVRPAAAVPLTELEQNQDKLLPNLQATHICG